MKPKIKKENYYSCSRCRINSLTKDSMCPCPRGGCEAKVKGIVKTTIEIIKS